MPSTRASIADTVAKCSSILCRNRVRSSQPAYLVAGMIMPVVTSRDVSMPMSMRYIVKKLRSIRPAPASRTSVSAIWTHDQPACPAAGANAAGPGPAAFLQHLVNVGRRGVQCGNQPEDETGGQAHDEEEGERAPVHREHHPVGDADALRFEAEPPNPDDRQQQPHDTGDERQQECSR